MEPAVDNWRDELKKFFRSIENISEIALKAIKCDRTRNNLPFDDSFKDFILNRSSARIAHVYTNLMHEDTLELEDEQMLSNQDVNHPIDESGHANTGQQFILTSNIPAYMEQMPIILAQPNNQCLASNTTASTTFVQGGDQLTEQLISSIPPNQSPSAESAINRNPQQELDAQSIRMEAVANEPFIESNSNKHIEMLKKVAEVPDMELTSTRSNGAKCVQKTSNSNERNPETIDLTSDQEEATDSLDSNPNNDGQARQNDRRQKVHEAKGTRATCAAQSSELNISSLKIVRNCAQQSTNITPGNVVEPVTSDVNLELKSMDGVIPRVNSQIQSVFSNTNTESNSQTISENRISDHVIGDDEHRQEDDSEPAGRQDVSNTRHPKMFSDQQSVKSKANTMPLVGGHKSKNYRVNTKQRKRHKCDYCEYSTEIKTNITMHIRTHTNERPYECVVCNKKFTQTQHLNRHMKTHRDLFQFQCSNCRQGFSHKTPWKLHERRCKAKQFECYSCSRKFYEYKGNLLRHMQGCHK